ncbi:MAG: CCA tRNA nucleotidyltransferase [Candidatus Melainabacteria bacterium]|nr:CCA tRNA nucleotidyltransferase [Candidatus Melainabacteria bacterium]
MVDRPQSQLLSKSTESTCVQLVVETWGWTKDNVINPATNAALIEPFNAVAHTINAVSKKAVGLECLVELSLCVVPPSQFLSKQWLAQSLAGGLAMVLPYGMAGRLTGGVLRSTGRLTRAEAGLAQFFKSEQAAQVFGAALYDGMRVPKVGETHVGNALGGATAFYVFTKGNAGSQTLSGLPKAGAYMLIGATGAMGQHTVAQLWSNGRLPGKEELAQAALGGSVMNLLLPPFHKVLLHGTDNINLRLGRGVDMDRYLAQHEALLAQSPRLQRQIHNSSPWLRVQYPLEVGLQSQTTPYASYLRQGEMVRLPGISFSAETNLAKLGHELSHAQSSRSTEVLLRQARMSLEQGDKQGAWQHFYDSRIAVEIKARLFEALVARELTGARTPSVTEVRRAIHEDSVNGLTYRQLWQREFEEFCRAGGEFVPAIEYSGGAEHFPYEQKLAAARKVAQMLLDSGHVSYFVGGGVRDKLIGREPKDIDIATSASVKELQEIFREFQTIEDRGKEFGSFKVVVNGIVNDVTTFRADGPYTDGRRPDWVRKGTPQEDADRRDLTVNAIFEDPFTGKVEDFAGGERIRDLTERKIIRAVGDAHERINEDALRMMRAVRFATRLGFELDPTLKEVITSRSGEIHKVSVERIRDELQQILSGPDPVRGLELLHETGLLSHILLSGSDAVAGVARLEKPLPGGQQQERQSGELAAADRDRIGLAVRVGQHIANSRASWEVTFAGMLSRLCPVRGDLPSQAVDFSNVRLPNIVPIDRVTGEPNSALDPTVSVQQPKRASDTTVTQEVMKSLCFTGADIKRIEGMLNVLELTSKASHLGRTGLVELLENKLLSGALQIQDVLAKIEGNSTPASEKTYIEAMRATLSHNLAQPPVLSGADLMSFGYRPSSQMGVVVREARAAQVYGEVTAATIREWVDSNYGHQLRQVHVKAPEPKAKGAQAELVVKTAADGRQVLCAQGDVARWLAAKPVRILGIAAQVANNGYKVDAVLKQAIKESTEAAVAERATSETGNSEPWIKANSIYGEFRRILTSQHSQAGLNLLSDTGVLSHPDVSLELGKLTKDQGHSSIVPDRNADGETLKK